MTWEEWASLSKVLRVAYTNQNFMCDEYTVKLWYAVLKDLPHEAVNASVQRYIMSEHFPPAPADIRNIAVDMVTKPTADWSQAYGEVQQAIRRYGYYQENTALEKLSETARETVKRIGWQTMCMSENPMADRAAFRDIYNQIANRTKQEARLPENLRTRITAMQNNLLEG